MSRLNYAREEMEKAFPAANFDPDPETLNNVILPDVNDIHVVAVAVAAQARTIVTYNVQHFPDRSVAPVGLHAETPDEFCARLFHEAQTDVIDGARLHRASLKRPSYDPGSYLDHLKSLQLARIADLLRTSRAEPKDQLRRLARSEDLESVPVKHISGHLSANAHCYFKSDWFSAAIREQFGLVDLLLRDGVILDGQLRRNALP
jgi:hypothetical protein